MPICPGSGGRGEQIKIMKTKVILIVNSPVDYVFPKDCDLRLGDIEIVAISRYRNGYDYNGQDAMSWLDRFGADTYIFTKSVLNF